MLKKRLVNLTVVNFLPGNQLLKLINGSHSEKKDKKKCPDYAGQFFR